MHEPILIGPSAKFVFHPAACSRPNQPNNLHSFTKSLTHFVSLTFEPRVCCKHFEVPNANLSECSKGICEAKSKKSKSNIAQNGYNPNGPKQVLGPPLSHLKHVVCIKNWREENCRPKMDDPEPISLAFCHFSGSRKIRHFHTNTPTKSLHQLPYK